MLICAAALALRSCPCSALRCLRLPAGFGSAGRRREPKSTHSTPNDHETKSNASTRTNNTNNDKCKTQVLQLKALGVADVVGFDFMDRPPAAAVVRSLELLLALGALDAATGALTAGVGAPMARLPVDPMFAKVLLASGALGCSVEAMQVVGLVSSDSVFYSPR